MKSGRARRSGELTLCGRVVCLSSVAVQTGCRGGVDDSSVLSGEAGTRQPLYQRDSLARGDRRTFWLLMIGHTALLMANAPLRWTRMTRSHSCEVPTCRESQLSRFNKALIWALTCSDMFLNDLSPAGSTRGRRESPATRAEVSRLSSCLMLLAGAPPLFMPERRWTHEGYLRC